jgi:hypothetical protein
MEMCEMIMEMWIWRSGGTGEPVEMLVLVTDSDVVLDYGDMGTDCGRVGDVYGFVKCMVMWELIIEILFV